MFAHVVLHPTHAWFLSFRNGLVMFILFDMYVLDINSAGLFKEVRTSRE